MNDNELFKKYKTMFDELNETDYELIDVEYRKRPSGKNLAYLCMRHISCGNKYWTTWNHFQKRGQRCKICSNKLSGINQRKSNEQYLKEVNNVWGDEYTVLTPYVTTKDKILVRHNMCGNEFWTLSRNFIKGHGCNKCCWNEMAQDRLKTQKQFELEVSEHTPNIKIIGKYVGSQKYIKVRCKICGNEWECISKTLIEKHSVKCSVCCPISKGEMVIEKYLIKNNILYQRQYKYFDCKNIDPLPFDFAIKNSNGDVLCLIEYDGQQHFKPVRFNGIDIDLAVKNFIRTVNNDIIKNNYCKYNNIKLIRIPYWNFDGIEDILQKELIQYRRNYT